MKRILINATQPEELRVALVDGQKLYDLDLEIASKKQCKSNIYKGKITRVEPSLEAAFIDYGAQRHGFLPLKEVTRSYYQYPDDKDRDMREQLPEGLEVIVQVEKEERGNKGAALTTYISLAGRYLVLMPTNPRAGGVSRRIEGDERSDIREALAELEVPDGMGMIVRTNGVGKSAEELQWDLDYLAQLWAAIDDAAAKRPGPFLLYQESNIIIRALRDYLRKDVGEVLIDEAGVFAQAQEFMQMVMPANLSKLKHYNDEMPLFSRYQIESQIESAFRREIRLPSGGSLVVDHTEALTAIDINSARATGGSDIEETALNTNLEAAAEIGRQLRLRDLGGLIVIDFIDMGPNKNQRAVEEKLEQAVGIDRARVQIGRISRFGLLEMSRQRLHPALGEYSHQACPRCQGQGSIRSVDSLALSVLRLLEEEAMKDRTVRVVAQVPVSVAAYLLNEQRDAVNEIAQRCKVELTVVPNQYLETPHYEIRRIRDDQTRDPGNRGASHDLHSEATTQATEEAITYANRIKTVVEPAAVQQLRSTAPPAAAAPAPVEGVRARFPSLLAWLKWILGIGGGKADKNKAASSRKTGNNARNNRQQNEPRKSSNKQPRRNSSNDRNKERRSGPAADSKKSAPKRDNAQNRRNKDASGPSKPNKGQKPQDNAKASNGNTPPKTDINPTAPAQNLAGNPAGGKDDNAPAASHSSTEGNPASAAQQGNNASGTAASADGSNRRRRGRRGGRRGGRRTGANQGSDNPTSAQNEGQAQPAEPQAASAHNPGAASDQAEKPATQPTAVPANKPADPPQVAASTTVNPPAAPTQPAAAAAAAPPRPAAEPAAAASTAQPKPAASPAPVAQPGPAAPAQSANNASTKPAAGQGENQ